MARPQGCLRMVRLCARPAEGAFLRWFLLWEKRRAGWMGSESHAASSTILAPFRRRDAGLVGDFWQKRDFRVLPAGIDLEK
jgi:hypothetical protein